MNVLLNYRVLNLFGATACATGLLMAIFYFQEVLALEPCPMCIFQRVAMLAAGLVFAVAAIHGPKASGRWVYTGLTLIPLGIGAFIAGRHTWLQKLPEDQRPSCGPTLDYLMDMMPLRDVVETVLKGDGNCAKIDWTFLGQSLPAWTLVAFAGLMLLTLAAPLLARRA